MGNFGTFTLYRIGAKAAATLILEKSLELDQHISDRFLYQSVCGNVKRCAYPRPKYFPYRHDNIHISYSL